jgi:uroporphyrinogen-III decarboxylase
LCSAAESQPSSLTLRVEPTNAPCARLGESSYWNARLDESHSECCQETDTSGVNVVEDAQVTHHCCGSSRALIPRFIECGMDSLQTIQPRAAGMNPYELKREFGGRITLHGAVDVQGWLQQATPAEIESEVNRLMDVVGAGGGYILAPCHHIQPDTPLDNVLAVYRTIARRRGTRLPEP